jgi:predicted O-methyltransferase YrrM
MLYGVDNYKPYYDVFEAREVSELESDMIKAESLLKQKHSPYKDKIKFFECSSVEAANYIDDESLDFIFIDADHSYESVLQDLTIWYPKLKQGGLLTGHDYYMKPVEQAVNDFRSLNTINSLMGVYLSSYAWKK